MNVLDLFSGIGGFSLGLERAGMRTVALCEIEPYARALLAKHWPDVPCHADIRIREFIEGEADVICGGFPCQDISDAGHRTGLSGERSGLWRELLRAIRLVRPIYAIVENVAALLNRGMGTVLGDLAEIGQDAEWHCIPARAVGAPHIRDRVWIIVADPARGRHGLDGLGQALERQLNHPGTDLADAESCGWDVCQPQISAETRSWSARGCRGERRMADAECIRCDQMVEPIAFRAPIEGTANTAQHTGLARWRRWWSTEPAVGRVAHGVSNRVDRLKGLGNAVVPQIPEIIGRAIMTAHVSNVREDK